MKSSNGYHSRGPNAKPNRSPLSGSQMGTAKKEAFLKEAWKLYKDGVSIKQIADTLDKPYGFTCRVLGDAMKEYKKDRLADMENFLVEQIMELNEVKYELRAAWSQAIENRKKPDDRYMIGVMKAMEDQRKILGNPSLAFTTDKDGKDSTVVQLENMTEDQRIQAIKDIVVMAIDKSQSSNPQ